MYLLAVRAELHALENSDSFTQSLLNFVRARLHATVVASNIKANRCQASYRFPAYALIEEVNLVAATLSFCFIKLLVRSFTFEKEARSYACYL